MNIGHVAGGTHAGWRTVKAAIRKDWTCGCGARNKYFWINCPVCHTPRPEEE